MKFIFALAAVIAFGLFAFVCADKDSVPICLQPKEVGPCRKAAEVFFYNKDTNRCEEFIYGGCLGNKNRFETKEECEKNCQNEKTE